MLLLDAVDGRVQHTWKHKLCNDITLHYYLQPSQVQRVHRLSEFGRRQWRAMVEWEVGQQQRIQTAGPAAKEEDAFLLRSQSLVQGGARSCRASIYL